MEGLNIENIERNFDSVHDYRDCLSLDNMFNIIHFNSQSLRNNFKFDTLKTYINLLESKTQIIAITETWLNDEEILNYSLLNYNSFFKNRKTINNNKSSKTKTNYGGIAVFSHISLQVEQITIDIPECESLILKTNINNTNTLIIIIYRTGNNFKTFIENLTAQLNDYQNFDLIFMGDYNINLLKNSYNANKLTETFAEMHCISLINSITRPASETCLDHCFSNINTTQTYSGTLNLHLSDHLATYFSVFKSKRPTDDDTKFLAFNWRKYNSIRENIILDISNEVNQLDIKNNINTTVSSFYKIIDKNIQPCFKLKPCKTHFNQPWINNYLYNDIKQRDRLYKIYKKNPTSINFANFKKFRNYVKNQVRKSKTEFCDKHINNATNSKDTWKSINDILIKSKQKITIPRTIIYENQTLTNKHHILEAFNKHFISIPAKLDSILPKFTSLAKNSTNATNINLLSKDKPTKNGNDKKMFKLQKITTSELKNLINLNHFKNDPNGTPGIVYKDLNDTYITFATNVFNESIETGNFPDDLKIARVVPLFKSGEKNNPTNYRPLSLLKGLSKIIETVTKHQLTKYLDDINFFTNSQHGFRKNHSTNTALITLLNYIRKYNDMGHYVLAIFLDLSKAFDTVNHKILCKKLEDIGMDTLTLSWFRSFLEQRKQYISIDDKTTKMLQIDYGVPQGSVLGPLLFLIYINDIVKINDSNDTILFADDTVLLTNSKNPENLCIQATNSFSKILDYLLLNRLSLNFSKTHFVIFSNKHIKGIDTLQTLNGTIKRTSIIKYLGVILQENLDFTLHINNVVKNLNIVNNVLYRLRLFVNLNTLVKIYYSLAYPHIIYCMSNWALTFKTHIKKVKVAMNNIIRTILFVRREEHINTNSLYNKLNLQTFIQVLATRLIIDYINVDKEFINHSYNTRNKANKNVFLSYYSTNKGKRSFNNLAAKIFNLLPTELKQLKLTANSKLKLKLFISKLDMNRLETLIYG